MLRNAWLIGCIFFASCLTAQQGVLFNHASGLTIPLFAPGDGQRWGSWQISRIIEEPVWFGPFEVDAGKMRPSHLTLRFCDWPGSVPLASPLDELGEWTGFQPGQIDRLRIEREGLWALVLETVRREPETTQAAQVLSRNELFAERAELLAGDTLQILNNVRIHIDPSNNDVLQLLAAQAQPVSVPLR